MWLEAGMVIAMSGTTIAGLLLEVAPAWTAPAGAAEADRTMPPLINATAGRDAQILRIGKVIVRTRRTLGMTPRSNPSARRRRRWCERSEP